MRREEAIDVLKRLVAYDSDVAEAKQAAIEALSAEAVQVVRCKDCRHYLIDGFTATTGWCYEIKNSVNEDDYCSYGENVVREVVEDAINRLPPADRPTGEWIDTSSGDHYMCSVCGRRAGYWFNEENSCEYSLDMSEWLSNYCPNCGAKMGGDDE